MEKCFQEEITSILHTGTFSAQNVFLIMLVALERLHFGISIPKEKQLRITIPEDLEYNGLFDDLFATYTSSARLEQVKTVNLGTMYELRFFLDLKDPSKEKEFIDALRCRNGNLTVVLGTILRNKDDL